MPRKKQTYKFLAFLSFIFPGSGQLAKGNIKKAISIWIVLILLLVLKITVVAVMIDSFPESDSNLSHIFLRKAKLIKLIASGKVVLADVPFWLKDLVYRKLVLAGVAFWLWNTYDAYQGN